MEYHIVIHTDIYQKYLKDTMNGPWDVIVFKTSSKDLANELLAFLNSNAPKSLLTHMTCVNSLPTIDGPHFEINEVAAATIVVSPNYPFKKSDVDFEAYPYNYLFIQGHTDRKETLAGAQAYVDTYYPDIVDFVKEMRSKFGPTIM